MTTKGAKRQTARFIIGAQIKYQKWKNRREYGRLSDDDVRKKAEAGWVTNSIF